MEIKRIFKAFIKSTKCKGKASNFKCYYSDIERWKEIMVEYNFYIYKIDDATKYFEENIIKKHDLSYILKHDFESFQNSKRL